MESEESDCNCEGTCTCENPSDTPTSSDSEGEVIEISSTEDDFSLAERQHGIMTLVKTETTDRPSEVADQEEPTAGTSLEVKPFKTKCIERKEPYVCHICGKSITIQSDYIKHMKETQHSWSSCKAHQKSHGVKLKCSACPDGTTKMYSSTTSLNIHKRGKHGEGWYAACGKNCQWKSMYARHIKKCKVCIKKLADFRLNRYDFMRHINLDSVY